MARKTKEEAERTYRALLTAAASLFVERGVAVTTLGEIAERAGVTRGALYWHFKGKDDVIRSLWQSYAMPKLRPIEQRIRDLPDEAAYSTFRNILADLVNLVTTDEQVGQAIRIVVLNVEATDRMSELQAFLKGERNRFKTTLTGAFATLTRTGALTADFPPDLMAKAFLGFMTGLLDQHFSPMGDIDLTREGQDLLEIHFKGLLAR